jgi:ABC-type lipoprotein export system ATPase subunit
MGPPDGRPLLEARAVTKRFGDVTALDRVDLAITPGQWTAVTGPSGSGKTTLLQLLAALESPDSGQVLHRGRDLAKIRLNRYRHRVIGIVFQLHNLLPHLDVAGNVEVALYATGQHGGQRAARVAELLDEVDLAHLHDRKPPELSGGERQRVAIARALANKPEVLLADEPTGSLDPRNVTRLLDLLTRYQREHSMSIVMVTHDAGVSARADRVLLLRGGRFTPSDAPTPSGEQLPSPT